MLYKDFQGLKLSALGFGAMRLPVVDGQDSQIDQDATQEMVDYAMAHGVNYYDTAWGYHEGNSGVVMGRALAKHPRDSYYIATKFPGYDLANMDKVEEIFERQLEKTGMGYFDFYLIHNVCELNIDEYLNPEHGIMPYLLEQKKAGRIRHLGFSAHGAIPVMERFLEAYGEHMEFCQIQLNYLDCFPRRRPRSSPPFVRTRASSPGRSASSRASRRCALRCPACPTSTRFARTSPRSTRTSP